ncbi:hypothetical protein SSX86_001943 [Deinandra increscens subsp. villosa]|uniref:Reverse transcriptase Ty1/copia-type domain-containing protein n=1 Tax=Deinandra increscens subsp. villosa TaxID=3103831 RepID=A0AAP0DX66_9ASTR
MIEEMDALDQNNTWTLVNLPTNKKAIGCKWLFTIKINPDGSLARLKAHLVAKGYAQVYGMDYSEAFSPGAKMSSGESGKVCRLRKSLYGLKKSPRAWFGKFNTVVTEFGLRRSSYDHSAYFASSAADRILLVVYVDDIVITGSDRNEIQRKGIYLSQRKYCLDVLRDYRMIEAKNCDAPMIPNGKLGAHEGDLLEEPEKYRRIVGKLNYLTITRPDIAFPVSVVSQFMSSPRTSHWEAVYHILKYLKGAPGRGILYQNNGHHTLQGFTDADYNGDPTSRRSTTGYCILVGGNLVSWKSKKQTIHIANNPVFHERTKHIEVDCHFTREKLEDGTIATPHVRSGEQLADVFTKALPGSRISYICNKLGMINIYAPA